jgi:hypothetical protein
MTDPKGREFHAQGNPPAEVLDAVHGAYPIDLFTYNGDALLGCVLLGPASDHQYITAFGAGLLESHWNGAVWQTLRTPTGDRVLAALRELLVGHNDDDRPRALRTLAASDTSWSGAVDAALALHAIDDGDPEAVTERE